MVELRLVADEARRMAESAGKKSEQLIEVCDMLLEELDNSDNPKIVDLIGRISKVLAE